MSHKDLEYFRERATAERALARAANRADIAAIHDELAQKYQALVEEGAGAPVKVSA